MLPVMPEECVCCATWRDDDSARRLMRRRQPPGFFAFYRIIDTDEVLAEFSDGDAVWLRQTLIKRDLPAPEHFFQGIRGGDELLELGIQLLFHLYSQLVAAAAQDNNGLEQIAMFLLLNEWLSRVSVVLSALMDLKFVLIDRSICRQVVNGFTLCRGCFALGPCTDFPDSGPQR